MLSDVTKEDLEVYVGKWFEIDDPETEKVQKLLSNGSKVLTMKTLAKDGGMTQERLRELGYELIYKLVKVQGDRKMRWTIVRYKENSKI